LIKRLFLHDGRIRAGWRFVMFLALYQAGDAVFNIVLPRIHFPEFALTWWSVLANDALDFAFVAALTWLMSRIERERYSAYGLPLIAGRGDCSAPACFGESFRRS